VGNSRKSRTENKRDVSDVGQSAQLQDWRIKKSEQPDRQNNKTSVPGDTAECCSVSEIKTLLPYIH
jgi:hypothetical protein